MLENSGVYFISDLCPLQFEQLNFISPTSSQSCAPSPPDLAAERGTAPHASRDPHLRPGRPQQILHGSHHLVMDYLVEEVLGDPSAPGQATLEYLHPSNAVLRS